MLTIIMQATVTDGLTVELFQTARGYVVRYGLDRSPTYTSIGDALDHFRGSCGHALACEGHTDNA